MAIKFEKSNAQYRNLQKNKPKKQANFNLNKPKNKQPASLQKKQQTHKKTSPNSQENRKVGNTGQNCQKPTLLMTSPTKNTKPKKFFSLQTRGLAESF